MRFWQENDYWKYAAFIAETERAFAIPQTMLAILLWQSSAFDPKAIASTNRHKFGSIGIANIMHAAGVEWGLIDKQGHDGRYDPFASIRAAGAYLAKQHAEFGNWRRACIAYKWGHIHLKKSLRLEHTEQYPCPADTLAATDQLIQVLAL